MLCWQVTDKRTKLVHVYRNPRAVLVSMYFQNKTAEGLKTMGDLSKVTLEGMGGVFMTGQGTSVGKEVQRGGRRGGGG